MKFFTPLVLLVLLAGLPLFAQNQEGRILGTITDSSGSVVVGARVTIQNTATGVARNLVTNDVGDYNAVAMKPGSYVVTAEFAGFKKTVSTPVLLEVGRDVRVDLKLQAGATNETVEVTAEGTLADTTDSTLNGVLGNRAINQLPLQGRDFQNLLNLHPGVQRAAGGGFQSITSNGLRPDDNNFVIDGAVDNDAYYGESAVNEGGILGTPASTLPLDSIQEFNTQEAPQADYGEKPGVVVNLGLKSGTDQIHGTAYYFHRNAAFDARNYFDHTLDPITLEPSKSAALILHQFGASIGGPIIKGKWFYFANYEGVRSKVGNPYDAFTPITRSLATPDNPGGDPEFSIVDALHDTGCDQTPLPANCSPLSMSLLSLLPTNPGFTASLDPSLAPAINFNFNNTNRADNLVFKSDYHLNDHHSFSGRYIYANSDQVEEDAIPIRQEWLSHAKPVTQVFGGDWTWTPNSKWVNVARFSFNRFSETIAPLDSNVNPTDYGLNTGITDPRLFGFPRINPGNADFDYMGGNSSWPLATTPSHTETFSDSVAYTRGKHALRFGGDFMTGGVKYDRAGTGRGRIDLRTLDDFLTGNVRSWRLLYGDPARNLSLKSFGLFVQDDYRVTPRLTLNLGLRYDVTFPVKDSQNRIANFEPSKGIVQVGFGISQPYQTNYNNFSPRVGFAWDAFGSGKTILRAGMGMIYIQPSIRTFVNSAGINLNPSALIQPGANGNINAFLLTGADPDLINWSPTGPIFPVNDQTLNECSADSPCSFFGVDQHLKSPYVLNYNLSLQQQITRDSMLQVAYVANHGVRLYSTVDINQADLNLIPENGTQLARPMTASCPDPVGLGVGNAPCYPYISFLNFLGNQSNSSYQSLQVTFTKRYSHGLYMLAGYTYGHAIDTAGNTNNLGFPPQNSLDYGAERADGDFDIRHRFTLSFTYDLPSKKSWGQLLEGWQVNSIIQYETGIPVLVYDNSNDLSGTGEGFDNASNERWNIQGKPGNLKWSAQHPIPFLSNTYDDDGNVIARDPVCTSVANTPALLESLDYVGGCYAQNGTILYPQAFYTFGNMGRNALRGPGFVNWDASVSKVFKFNERFSLQLRGEIFNVANHANFAPGSISGELGSPDDFGLAKATPDVQTANPVVGSGGSRHIQIGAKVIW